MNTEKTDETGGLKIIDIDMSNVRKIKVFRMALKGGNLHIAGDTDKGKTTAISALWDILNKSQDSLTHGTRKGVIRIKLKGDGKVILAERITTKSQSILKLTNEKGDTLLDESGEKVTAKDFNRMISALSINPHQIKDMGPTEKIKTLLKSAKVDVDIIALDEEIAEKEAERLEAHQDAERVKPSDVRVSKTERVSVTELVNELSSAEAVNLENKEHREKIQGFTDNSAELAIGIEERQTALNAMIADKKALDQRITDGTAFLTTLKDEDTQVIKDKLTNADELNKKASEYELYIESEKKYDEYKSDHEKLVDEVKDLKEKKKTALEGAQWPLNGLFINDGKIYYNDCLLDTLGESKQMLVCAALAMSDILAHPIRVVRMDGVESMSADDMQALNNMYNGHGIQVLSTRVSRNEIDAGEIEIINGEYDDGQSHDKESE